MAKTYLNVNAIPDYGIPSYKIEQTHRIEYLEGGDVTLSMEPSVLYCFDGYVNSLNIPELISNGDDNGKYKITFTTGGNLSSYKGMYLVADFTVNPDEDGENTFMDNYKPEDVFMDYDYETYNGVDNTPVLYKTNVNEFINEIDYDDRFPWVGTEEIDGVVYDKWLHLVFLEDEGIETYRLTKQIVFDGVIDESKLPYIEGTSSLILPKNILWENNNELKLDIFTTYQINFEEVYLMGETKYAASYKVLDNAKNRCITYKTIDGSIVEPNETTRDGEIIDFGANIVSNTYENGVGVITFDGDVTKIGNEAFSSCSELTEVTIPNSVTYIGSSAFRGCSELTSIIVSEDNTVYDSRNNCNAIIETSTNELIAGCKTTVIPDSVTSIGTEAFYLCSGLTSITIPDSVTNIGNSAFRGCSELTSIYCYPTTPPTLDGTTVFTDGTKIYVPFNRVETYSAAENWSRHANSIEAMPDSTN